MSSVEQKSPDMVAAEQRLDAARKESEKIAATTLRLRAISSRLNEQICGLDIPLERRKFVESNIDQYFKRAEGGGELPDYGPLLALEDHAAAIRIAFDHVGLRLLALSAAAGLARSEELNVQAHILTLRSQNENLRAAQALATVREEIGEDAVVSIERGRSQELEAEADLLVEQAAALRREAEEQLKKLRELQKGIA